MVHGHGEAGEVGSKVGRLAGSASRSDFPSHRSMTVSSPTPSLRALLDRPGPILLAGAHNPLSGRIVERAGFDAVWASGYEISASFAVPDANILTMAETLAVAKAMQMAVRVPIIADCDNGYGNAVNVIRTVREYEAAGIAGICIEDNAFPKRCSFYETEARALESEEEFVGKVEAAAASRRSADFLIIARTEALIAGLGLEAALRRARAYADAGADLCLVHSKAADPSEIYEVAAKWDRRAPLVCVPTKYDNASVDELHRAGIKMVIFANYALRSAIKAMQLTLSTIIGERRAAAARSMVASLEEVDEIVGFGELLAHEEQYLRRKPPAALSKVAGQPMASSNRGNLPRR
jgi:phosphoenolpyruvate phosphomutase